jgi:hypothetical protein
VCEGIAREGERGELLTQSQVAQLVLLRQLVALDVQYSEVRQHGSHAHIPHLIVGDVELLQWECQ